MYLFQHIFIILSFIPYLFKFINNKIKKKEKKEECF